MNLDAHALPVLLCSTLAVGCADDSGPVDRQQAADRVVDALVDDNAAALVFAHAELVKPDDVLAPYAFQAWGESLEAIEIDAPSWLVWIDDRPGARFEHDTRIVLVDEQTGELTVTESTTWPVLDGQGLWVDEQTYWSEDEWMHATPSALGDMTPRQAELVAPPPIQGQTCGGNAGRAIVVNGWRPGESQRTDFELDAQDMAETLSIAGFTTAKYGPRGDSKYDGTNDATNLEMVFATAASQMKAGETLFVYLTGHGAVIGGKTIVGTVWEDKLASWLSKFDAGVEIIFVVDGCHSGGMLDSLTCTVDYAVSATNEALSSYGDLDVGETINPRDKGGEFTSSICGGIFELLTSPADIERIAAEAKADGDGFWEELMEEAFEDSKDLDEAFRRGWTQPQAQAGTEGKVKPQPPAVQAPECTPEPEPEPEPDPDPDPNPSACDESAAEDLRIFANILAGTHAYAAVCDQAEAEPKGNSVEHSDGTKSSVADGDVDILLRLDWSGCYELDGIGGCGEQAPSPEQHAATALGLSADTGAVASIVDLPCGRSDAGLTLCPADAREPAGDYYVVAAQFASDPASTPLYYQYGFVFDGDANPDNNYQAPPQYPSDFFDGTDTWYVASVDPYDGWRLDVTDARDGGFASVGSGARLVVTGDTLALVVPADELPAAVPQYRLTAFRHQGDWGADSTWYADVVPAVGEPLLGL